MPCAKDSSTPQLDQRSLGSSTTFNKPKKLKPIKMTLQEMILTKHSVLNMNQRSTQPAVHANCQGSSQPVEQNQTKGTYQPAPENHETRMTKNPSQPLIHGHVQDLSQSPPEDSGNSDMRKEDGSHIKALPFHHTQTKGETNNVIWTLMLFVEVLIYGSFSVLVNLSKTNGKLPFNTSNVVLLIEATKFVLSAVMYFPEFMSQNCRIPRLSIRICVSFSIPAVLYTLNNNLGLHMQTQMDPTTYQVLSNLKIATTGVLYRIIIKRKLTNYQWMALGLLMLAGVSDSYGGFHSDVPNAEKIFITAAGLAMMLTYTTISGLAAVFTEYMLKSQFKVSLHVQNMLLYSYGVALNLTTSWWSTEVSHDGSRDKSHGFLTGFTIYTWLIILTQAFNGLIMSVVMKHGSNITRLFIISGAMLTSTLLSMCLLGTAISVAFVVAAALVILAIYLYHL